MREPIEWLTLFGQKCVKNSLPSQKMWHTRRDRLPLDTSLPFSTDEWWKIGSIFRHRLHTLWHILPNTEAMDARQQISFLWIVYYVFFLETTRHLYSGRRLEYRHSAPCFCHPYSSASVKTPTARFLPAKGINEYQIMCVSLTIFPTDCELYGQINTQRDWLFFRERDTSSSPEKTPNCATRLVYSGGMLSDNKY